MEYITYNIKLVNLNNYILIYFIKNMELVKKTFENEYKYNIDFIEKADAKGLENIINFIKKNILMSIIIGYISYIIIKKKINQNNIEDYNNIDDSYESSSINRKPRRSITPNNVVDDNDDDLID